MTYVPYISVQQRRGFMRPSEEFRSELRVIDAEFEEVEPEQKLISHDNAGTEDGAQQED